MANSLELKRRAGIIPYSLREGYPTLSFSDEGATGEEEYIIKGANLPAFILVSMPPPVVIGNQIVLLPRRPMPGTFGLVTTKIDARPFQPDMPADFLGADPFYDYKNEYMILTISYSTEGGSARNEDRDDDDPQTFLEVSFDTSAEIFKIPGAIAHFGVEGMPAAQSWRTDYKAIPSDTDIPAAMVIPTTTYNVNWKLALNPDFKLFRSLIGRVNKLVDPLFFNAPKESILFAGYSGRRAFLWNTPTGVTVTPWDLTFKFIGRHVEHNDNVTVVQSRPENGGDPVLGGVAGWNHIYRPSTGFWERVMVGNNKPIYGTTSTWLQMFRASGLL